MRFPALARSDVGAAASVAFFAAIVVVLLGVWQIRRAHDAALTQAEQSARILTRSLSQHATRTFEGVDLLMSGAVERIEGNPDREHLKAYLERRVSRAAELLNLIVIDAAGDWIADTLPAHPATDSKDRDYFAWHRDHPTRDLRIGDPILSRESGTMIIPLSRRFDNADGSFGGIVFAAFTPETLQTFYKSVSIGSKGSVGLVDPGVHLLARYPPVARDVSPDPARISQLIKTLAPPSGISRNISAFDGIDRIFAFEHVEGYPLIVVASVAVEDALAAWRRDALIEAVVLAAACAVLFALGVGLERNRRKVLLAEKASRDLNSRYQLLAENSSDLVALKPSFAESHSYISPSCRAILGWEPEEFAALAPERFIHPDHLDRVAAEFAALTPDNPRVVSLQRVRHKDGHYPWLEVVFQLTGAGSSQESVVITARDVTARHEAEQALIESEARYRVLADASSDMIQRLDLAGNRRYVSPAAMEIFGLHPMDMIGTHPVDYIHPEDKSRVGALIADVAAGRRDHMRSIHRIQHKDGHYIWVEVQFRLVRDKASGVPLEIVSNLRDVSERESLQRKLGETNHRLRMAEEIANVGHWRVDLADNRVTWSDEVYRIYGLDPRFYEPDVETAIEKYHPDDRAEVARCVAEAVKQGRDYEFKLRVVRPDGDVRHVVSRGLCEIDRQTGELAAIFGAIMDVTELAEAERDVREKSALLEATLDSMEQALIKVASDGTIELANRRFAELLDIPAAILQTARPNFEDVLEHLSQSGEYGRTDAAFQAHVATRGAPFTLGTYERSRPNGTVLEVRTVQAPGGAFVRTYSDITPRRQAEAAMRESEAKYRALAENTNDVITRLGLDFKRQYVSPASKRVLGYSPEEMLDVRPSASIHPDEAAGVRALAVKLVAGEIEGDRVVTTYRALHKDGHWVWLEAGMNLVRDEASGAPICLTCTLRDVSERQRAARHLERARVAAEQAANAKAEFLANMSHELRTPLTGMLGVHDLLRAGPNLDPEQRRLVTLASEAGRSLLAIVNDILDFSKIEAGQLAIETVPFAIGALLGDCRALVAEGLNGKAIDFELRASADLPEWLIGDPTRVRQILLNLLTNAVKFTDRGVIRINAAYEARTGWLRIEVTDSGIGIPPDKLPMLFGRFSQADASTTRRYGGTGLGLAISKRLTDLMSGTIGVESQVGRGSTFWFELPLRPFEGEALREQAQVSPIHAGRRVLLAEDNGLNREIIASMLSHQGYEVTTVVDGAAAVEAVKGSPAFDLILMDLQMPVMDGLTATTSIRALPGTDQAARAPIIGLTANAMTEDVERCLAVGMEAHVAKPINWPDLFAAMEKVLDKATALDSAVIATAERFEVLNELTLEGLSNVIGKERLAALLRRFETDLGRRMETLDTVTPAGLAEQAHSIAGLAGQLGFVSLSRLCTTIEVDARRDGGLEHVAALRDAVLRAAEAARSSRFLAAA